MESILSTLKTKPISLIITLPFNANLPSLPPFIPLTPNKICEIDFPQGGIIKISNKLNRKKAHGHDEISTALLKIYPKEAPLPLSLIFKKFLSTGSFPLPGNMQMCNRSIKKRAR